MGRATKLLLLLLLPLFASGQTTFIVNSYQFTTSGGGGSYDADAQTYFNALTTAGITPTTQQKTDINTFIVNAKANGWWTTRKAIYFPVWSSASANAINLKNPGTYNLTFVNAPTHAADGVAFNGTTQYANTGLPLNTMASANSLSISCYSQTNNTNTGMAMGAFDNSGTKGNIFIRLYNTASFASTSCADATSSSPARSGTTFGFYALSRTGSTGYKYFRNGTGVSVTSTSLSPLNSQNIYLGCYSTTTTAGGSFSNRKLSYADIGDGLTDTDELNHNTDVEALHDAFAIGQQ